MVEYESILESDAILLFEFSSAVVNYQEQPALVYYAMNETMHKYYPDFRLDLVDGTSIYIEVKPSQKLIPKQAKQKYLAITDHFQNQGELFLVLTEKEIRREPLIGNLKRINQIRFYQPTELQAFKQHIAICATRSISLKTMTEYLSFNDLIYSLACGLTTCDLTKNLLDQENMLTLKGDQDAALLF